MTRRKFLQTTAGLVFAVQVGAREVRAGQEATNLRIGMCDWSLRKAANLEAIALAREIGLDGVEVSGLHLRRPEVQEKYLKAAKQYNIEIPSVALGILNQVPLKSEPKAAIWLADSITVACNLGAKVILLAFFGKGELKMENEQEISRVVDVLKELGPRAAKAGVILGLENTLSAEDNLRILERVGEPAVQVYYDLKNSANRGRDVPREIRLLGERICQVHLKNGRLLLSQPGNVDFPACAEALRDIGYRGWLILETSSPHDLVADTRANIQYVRETFGG
ncbi:MAG TPA: sugar phosphate isomerase/epimerase [Armatimonadetes bacterium]|nr:sugar phosphate isomerase/epimerase [Armatimonadota bacterium]